jgi:hypothetical protein
MRNFMSVDKEEEIIILYALYSCGGKGRGTRIIFYIVVNGLIKPRPGDAELRQNGETVLENDLAFSRENLKEKRQLSMPKHGFWQITNLGSERLFRVAAAMHASKPAAEQFSRYTDKFITQMVELAKKLSEKQA